MIVSLPVEQGSWDWNIYCPVILQLKIYTKWRGLLGCCLLIGLIDLAKLLLSVAVSQFSGSLLMISSFGEEHVF